MRPFLQWYSNKCYVLWVCVCSLYVSGIQSACAVLYCHQCLVSLYRIFSTLSHKRHDFRIQVTDNVYFDFMYSLCLKHFSSEEELSGIWHWLYIGLHVKYLLSLSGYNKTLIFLGRSSKNTQMSNFKIIRPIEAKLFQRLYNVNSQPRPQ
jgi:hypothetical protein